MARMKGEMKGCWRGWSVQLDLRVSLEGGEEVLGGFEVGFELEGDV